MQKIFVTVTVIGAVSFFLLTELIYVSGREGQNCPLKRIGIYDLEMNVPPPSSESKISPADWQGLFSISRGVRERLREEDPEQAFFEFYDNLYSGHLYSEDDKSFSQGYPQNLPPAGPVYDSDYIVSGSVFQTNPINASVDLRTAVTKESVGTVLVFVDVEDPYGSGRKAVEGLIPLGEKIYDFQRRKRAENSVYAVYPNMDMYPQRSRIKTEELIKLKIQLRDCDDVLLENRRVELSSTLGQIEPQEVTTDENGEAEVKFRGGRTPGWAQVTSEYEWKAPCGHGPYKCSGVTAIAIEEQPDDVWIIKANLTQRIHRRAKKTQKIGETAIPPDHPLLKPGTYEITKYNSLKRSLTGNATIQMVIHVDASDGDFVYSGEEPLVVSFSGNVSQNDKEEKMEFINRIVSEFSTKRTDTYSGSFHEGSFEFHHTPEYQYVSAHASSEGNLRTEIKRFEDGQWRGVPYNASHTLGIGASWSSGEEGGSITRSKSGYSFTITKTETETKKDPDLGTITTVITTTLNGSITPFSKQ
ncbi:MAG: Ig-like domain-containing protein [Candidatus Aminicenantes bacterium]|nr:Ig-like domain-containing protein [Candidatus Aminicenantes bacterium]